MGTFHEDMARLEHTASKGDVIAGVKVIIAIIGAGKLAFGVLSAVLAAKAAIIAVAPWSAPLLAPAMLAMITRALIEGWSNLDTGQRRLAGLALKFFTGQLSVVD